MEWNSLQHCHCWKHPVTSVTTLHRLWWQGLTSGFIVLAPLKIEAVGVHVMVALDEPHTSKCNGISFQHWFIWTGINYQIRPLSYCYLFGKRTTGCIKTVIVYIRRKVRECVRCLWCTIVKLVGIRCNCSWCCYSNSTGGWAFCRSW